MNVARVIVCRCPLCKWEHTEGAILNNNALASVFGPGVIAAAAAAQQSQRMEIALQDHFRTHTLAEWVKAVTDRDATIAKLRGEVAA